MSAAAATEKVTATADPPGAVAQGTRPPWVGRPFRVSSKTSIAAPVSGMVPTSWASVHTFAFSHTPPLQGAPHWWPHVPQLPGSVWPFVSQPFVVFPSQSRKPGEQTKAQAPPPHVAVAFG
jgi:hypothetical protein